MSGLQTHPVLLPPTTTQVNLEAQSWAARVHICVCVASVENICKCMVRAVRLRQVLQNLPVLTRKAERLSAPLNHWLQSKEVTLIMSCQCSEIRMSTTISFPSYVCAHACICACARVCVYVRVRDRVSEGMQGNYRGRNVIYCAVSFGRRGREGEGERLSWLLSNFIYPPLVDWAHCFFLSCSVKCICCWELLWIWSALHCLARSRFTTL